MLLATRGFGETAQKTQEKEWLAYQPTIVTLKGTLSVKTFYGPPNYGENPDTDAKEDLPILIFKKPKCGFGSEDRKECSFTPTRCNGRLSEQSILGCPNLLRL